MTNIDVLLVHPDHLSRLFGLANDGREIALRRVIPCNSDLDKATATIDDEGRTPLFHCITSNQYKQK